MLLLLLVLLVLSLLVVCACVCFNLQLSSLIPSLKHSMHAGTWPFVKFLVLIDECRTKRSCGLGRLDCKHIYALRCFKFWKSVYISSNVVLKTVFSCFANSQDFNQLCYLYGVSVMCMEF